MLDAAIIGLSIASILLLVALGLAIVYGTMGVINLAHGEFLMFGAYSAVLATTHLGLNLFWCIPLGFAVGAGAAFLVERALIRFLYGRLLETLLATWGLLLIMRQLVVTQFGLALLGINVKGLGPGPFEVPLPVVLQQTLIIPGISVSVYRIFVLAVAVSLLIVTWWLLYRSGFGRQLRAVARNAGTAESLGINSRRVSALAFAYGGGLAGVAGVLLSGFRSVNSEMGTQYVVDAFLVVVVGGAGQIFGAVWAAGILGELNAFVSWSSDSIMGRVALLGAVIILLLIRPQGLFRQKIRSG